jgi:FAD linked oxidases, C-terminal domain/FMN-dependent dehydrogenase
VEIERLNQRLVHRALSLDGMCTGEHGVGCGKIDFLLAEHGEAVTVMRAIKTALDPDNLMNPGKILRVQSQSPVTISEAIQAINLGELEARARELLPQMTYDYYASGANDEATLRENRTAYERITLLPRIRSSHGAVGLPEAHLRYQRSCPSLVGLRISA